MSLRQTLASLVLAVLASPLAQATSYDVLNLPAVQSEIAKDSLIFSIFKAPGGRIFATGQRGHILFSDDAGETWNQAEVPVRSAITDIHFPTADQGWAVGHEGVILHSSDGGETWEKQYDGLRYGKEGLEFYEGLLEQEPDNEVYDFLVGEMEFAISQGADKPFFRVYFVNEKQGYAIGAYGMSVETFDGGKTWRHNAHTMENDMAFHLFDFAPLPEEGKYFLTGEMGLFLVADIVAKHSTKVDTVPWEGSFFASGDTADDAVVLGGLRGRMFRTADLGETWTEVEKPATSSIVDITRLSDDRLIAIGVAGEILISRDNGLSFESVPLSSGGRNYVVAEAEPGKILIGGPQGLTKLTLPN